MKRKILIVSALLTLASAGLFAAGTDFGSVGARDKSGLSLEQALTYAIQDEYLARSEYDAIMQTFGTVKPFSNIIRAEEQHIRSLRALFDSYDLEVPEDTSKSRVIVPPDLRTALEIGVRSEIDNIAMYRGFLGTSVAAPLPADVRTVMERLAAASENHLRAFRNNLSIFD